MCGIQEIIQVTEEDVPRGGQYEASVPEPYDIGADTFSRLCGIREVTRGTQEGVPRGGKRKAPTPETYVRGERQSARLKAKSGQDIPPVFDNKTGQDVPPVIDDNAVIVTHRSTSHVSADNRKDTINTVGDAPNPEGVEVQTESEDSYRKDVITSDEPPSYHPTQVERGSESPSLKVVEIEVISSPMIEDAGSSELHGLTKPDSPGVFSKSDVLEEFRALNNSFLSEEKCHGLPGQEEVDRPSATPSPKSGTLMDPWDDRVTKWFRQVHDHSRGHTGLDRTMSKLFEIPEVQRQSLRGRLPKDLEDRIAKKIKSCIPCQKNSPRNPTTQGAHFSCSVYKKMNRIAVDYIESLRPDSEGNDMIVVIIDCFSRFICLYPVKNKGTEVSSTHTFNG